MRGRNSNAGNVNKGTSESETSEVPETEESSEPDTNSSAAEVGIY